MPTLLSIVTLGYLFDLDETLVTYDPDVPGIFRNACASVGVEPTEDARDAIGPGYVETFRGFEESPYVGAARAAREAGLSIDPETFAERYIEAELAASHAPAGTVELLSELSPVGVVTNGYGPVQCRKLAETGLSEHVDALVCPDDVEAFKPDDEPFDAVTEAIVADEYVMVGDSLEYDIRPANARGYRTVLVGDGTDEGDGPTAVPDIRIESPAALWTLRELF